MAGFIGLVNGSAGRIPLKDGSVQTAVTSPPYLGLRKYDGAQGQAWASVTYRPMPGLPEIAIPGCDPDCKHEWGEAIPQESRHRYTAEQARARLELDKLDAWQTGKGKAAEPSALDDLPLFTLLQE